MFEELAGAMGVGHTDDTKQNLYPVSRFFFIQTATVSKIRKISRKVNIIGSRLMEKTVLGLRSPEEGYCIQLILCMLFLSLDDCIGIKCPSASECISTLKAGPICRCKNNDAALANGTCQLITGSVVEIVDWKLDVKWNPRYQDSESLEYKEKVAEIESSLFSSLCSRIGCTSVRITRILQGSIRVTFTVVFENNKTVSIAKVEIGMKQIVNDQSIRELNPDNVVKPIVQRK